MSMLARMLPVTSPWFESDSTTNEDLKKEILKDDRNMIVFGPTDVGKTCLLFQAGVSWAVEELIVMFVSPQPLTKMPLTIHGLHSPTATVLQSVKFVYYSTVKELIEFCSSVHTKHYYPDIIIIDSLEYYLLQLQNEGIDHGMAKISALLLDAASYIAKHSESKKCRLLLSVNDKYKTLVAISRQFGFISSHIIHETGNKEGKHCDLTMKTKDNVEFLSSYTIHDTEIRLDKVTFKSLTS